MIEVCWHEEDEIFAKLAVVAEIYSLQLVRYTFSEMDDYLSTFLTSIITVHPYLLLWYKINLIIIIIKLINLFKFYTNNSLKITKVCNSSCRTSSIKLINAFQK